MLVLKGFAVGLAMVAPVGPVALTLLGIGVERGRRHALEGAIGVAAADVVLVTLTAGLAVTTGVLTFPWMRPLEMVLGAILIGLGAWTSLRADGTRSRIARIDNPGQTLLVMTLLNPLSLAVWLAVVTALPADMQDPRSLAWFGVGVSLASLLWHSGLGLGASWAGRFASERVKRWSAVAGGIVIAAIGIALLA